MTWTSAVLLIASSSLIAVPVLADGPEKSETVPVLRKAAGSDCDSGSDRPLDKARDRDRQGPGPTCRHDDSGEPQPYDPETGPLRAPKVAPSAAPSPVEEEPVARAIRTIKECQSRYASIHDYSCTFYKRERINGRLTPLYVMAMKARTAPRSIYFKFESPYKGREAIYVEGRNEGKILAHDVGFTRFLAGTMELEPTSARAMEDNRHPITDAGIGNLIDTICRRWQSELSTEESLIVFDPDMTIGPRRCVMIESIHPHRQPSFQFHKVRLFIDSEHRLPIRFEGYDWPGEQGGPAELVEEYSYIDLRLNVGLDDSDFDPANRHYAFGRF